MTRLLRVASTTLLTLAWSVASGADGEASYDDYTIHYTAIATTQLQPEMAENYNIPRSRTRGLLTVNVTRDDEPVGANTRARVIDHRDRIEEISMRTTETGPGTAAIGVFPMADGERSRFELEVRPHGADTAYTVEFSTHLFTD